MTKIDASRAVRYHASEVTPRALILESPFTFAVDVWYGDEDTG